MTERPTLDLYMFLPDARGERDACASWHKLAQAGTSWHKLAQAVGAGVGFITLFGLAIRNGVMMISHIHHLVERDEVKDMYEAVKRGAEERLIPILMTALAAGFALVPLALSGACSTRLKPGAVALQMLNNGRKCDENFLLGHTGNLAVNRLRQPCSPDGQGRWRAVHWWRAGL